MSNAYQQNLPSTSHLNKIDQRKTPIAANRSATPPANNAPSAPWRIILYIGTETLTPMRLEINAPTIMGRADPAENYMPGIDFGPFGAQDLGVSRRHAVLLTNTDGVYIRDLGSTNGTHVNGFLVQPNQPYKLRDGDKVEMGQMQLRMQILMPPSK